MKCCYFWAGAPICYLHMLDKLQKLVCRTAGSSLAASPKCSKLKSYRYYFGKYLSELAELVLLPDSYRTSACYLSMFIDVYRCYKNVYVNSFFPCTA